jgi:hypothetical protein
MNNQAPENPTTTTTTIPPLALIHGISSLHQQTVAYRSFVNFNNLQKRMVGADPNFSYETPNPKRSCPTTLQTAAPLPIPQNGIPQTAAPLPIPQNGTPQTAAPLPIPQNGTPQTAAPLSQPPNDPEYQRFLDVEYPIRREARPKLSTYKTLESLMEVIPEAPDELFGKICQKCHKEYKGHDVSLILKLNII